MKEYTAIILGVWACVSLFKLIESLMDTYDGSAAAFGYFVAMVLSTIACVFVCVGW